MDSETAKFSRAVSYAVIGGAVIWLLVIAAIVHRADLAAAWEWLK